MCPSHFYILSCNKLHATSYSLQEKGALENFFTVMDVIIEDEEEKEKLLNKLMKKMQR